jgi:hypothetical protein
MEQTGQLEMSDSYLLPVTAVIFNLCLFGCTATPPVCSVVISS